MYIQRIQNLRQYLQEANVDAVLISNFYNILYLTGIKTLVPSEREAYVLLTQGALYFFTDGRYVSDELNHVLRSIKAQLKEIKMGWGLTKHIEDLSKQDNIEIIGFEEEDMKYQEFMQLGATGIKLVPLQYVGLQMRAKKEEREVDCIKKACEYTDQCLAELVPIIKTGVTEKEVVWKIEQWICEHGLEVAFDPIVAVDSNSAIAHYDTKTGNGKIKESSVVLIDFGVRYQGYISDITRMFFVGKQAPEIMKTYTCLKNAQQKAVKSVKENVQLKSIDATCRTELIKSGLPNYPHSTGHGVGLEVHELPKVSVNSTTIVQPYQVFTIEPGVYIPRKWGMRIEDTVWVNEDYKAVPLTQFPKEMIIQ